MIKKLNTKQYLLKIDIIRQTILLLHIFHIYKPKYTYVHTSIHMFPNIQELFRINY